MINIYHYFTSNIESFIKKVYKLYKILIMFIYLIRISNLVNGSYNPKCIVVQCGADSLIGDPIGGFNLTLKSLAECVKTVIKWEKPTLFLGGGNIWLITF